jgi:hypothetical protein
MTRTTIITAAGAFMVLSFISACNRDQDQATQSDNNKDKAALRTIRPLATWNNPILRSAGPTAQRTSRLHPETRSRKPVQLRGSVVPIAPFCVSKLVVSLPHDQLVQHRASCTGFSHGVRSNVSLVTS